MKNSGGRTTVVIRDLHTYYTLYCVYVITSGCTQGAAAEEDTVGGTAAEADAVGEQRYYHTRLLVHQSRWMRQTHGVGSVNEHGMGKWYRPQWMAWGVEVDTTFILQLVQSRGCNIHLLYSTLPWQHNLCRLESEHWMGTYWTKMAYSSARWDLYGFVHMGGTWYNMQLVRMRSEIQVATAFMFTAFYTFLLLILCLP